jgi:hypothetical protein
MANTPKPISLYPLKFEDVVTALLKTKPEPKDVKTPKKTKTAPSAKKPKER